LNGEPGNETLAMVVLVEIAIKKPKGPRAIIEGPITVARLGVES
jgi:hypothetical protein